MRSDSAAPYRFADLLSEPLRNGIYKSKEHHGSGVKVVNMGELFGHPRLRNVPMKRLELTEAELRKSSLKEGDLLFARRSLVAEGAGRCSIVKEIAEATTFESSIIRARPNPCIADSDYLYYFFASPQGRELMRTILRQVAVSGITGGDLAELQIPLPPLREQRTRASVMETLDDRITLLRETNATLEAIAQALFKSWFVDFDPVRAKMEGRTPEGMDEATAALFPDGLETSELGEVPRGWRVGQLGEVLKIAYGKNLPTSKLLNTGYPVYGGNGQIGFSDKFLYDSRQVLVACRGAASGKFNQSVPRSFVTNNSLVLESSDTTLLPFGYLKGCISRADLTPFVTGSAQPQVTIDNLKNFKLLVPSFSTLKAFESFSSPIEDRIEENQKQAQTLSTLRDTLLPRLISGQLRLPEAQAATEAALGGTLSV